MDVIRSDVRRKLAQRVRRRISEGVGRASYRVKRLQHVLSLPELTPIGERIVDEVNATGISIVHLDELGIPSNAGLKEILPRVCADLDGAPNDGSHVDGMEYSGGFKHCIPLNPSYIAQTYPSLFQWGLDESLLAVIENIIGLPLAYHGVVARKELVDGKVIGSRNWHRDSEDRNIIRVLIYLSDVLDNRAGPFEYVPLHLTPSERRLRRVDGILDDEGMRKVVPESQWRQCIGPAGTVIFGAVAKLYHHGRLPVEPRKVVSYYYTSREPTNELLCRENSFQSGIPFIDAGCYTKRQRDCLWRYQDLLRR